MAIDYTKYAFDKDLFLNSLIIECLTEMYERAQPQANVNHLLKEASKKPENERRFYDHYYLSQEEYDYIVAKYIKKYHLNADWKEDVDILIDCARNGYTVDKYIPGKDGKPGHSGYETKPSFEKTFGKDIAQQFINFLENRRDFYHFNRDEEFFRINLALGCSPTMDEETVKNYWRSQGIDLQIEPRHFDSNYFWEEEHGYLTEE